MMLNFFNVEFIFIVFSHIDLMGKSSAAAK